MTGKLTTTAILLALGTSLVGCTEERINPVCALECFDGLSGPVDIRRDDMGIVHIYADTDADVFFGSGYAQATDRLFQMDITRRRALGRRAEVLGEGSLGEDTLLRTIGIQQMGEANLALLRETEPATYGLLVAWIAGINQRIDEVLDQRAPLPHGFAELDYLPERWVPADAMAVGKLVLFGNANQIEFELLATIIRDFFTDIYDNFPLLTPLTDTFTLPPEDRPVGGTAMPRRETRSRKKLPPDAHARLASFSKRMAAIRPGASNNWAIRGEHTESGRSLIAGDPHQGLRSPSLMWAHHMNSADAGGAIDVAGFSFVGSPTVQLGHNRTLAWTATTNYPDTMDLLSVPVADGMAEVGGRAYTIVSTEEVFEVRDGETVTTVVERIPGLGVLLADDIAPIDVTEGDNRLLLLWPGFEATRDGHSFLLFDLAQDLGDFRAAVETMEIGNFNFIAATADEILYRSAPLVPARPWASDAKPPYAVLDGTDPEVVWDGTWLSPALMPSSDGGSRGWLSSANNDPYGFTADGAIDGDPFYFGLFFDPGTRAQRIEEEISRLVALGSVTRAQMEELQTDTHTVLADLLVPDLVTTWANVDSDPALADFRGRDDLAALVTLLENWDRRMVRSSEAGLAFHAFMSFVIKSTIADDLSVAFDAIYDANTLFVIKMALLALNDRFEGADAFVQEGKGPILLTALDQAATFMASRGTSQRWGDYHVTSFGSLWGEALDGGKHATDGADGTVNVSAGKFFDGDDIQSEHRSGSGAIFRMVTGFDEDGVPSASVNYPRGNSGEPDSPHFADTLDDWIEGVYRPYLFRTPDVVAASQLEISLEPE